MSDLTTNFPGATKTFTVLRRGATVVNGNRVLGNTTITTSLSVLLTTLEADIKNDKGGMQFAGQYKGSTFLDAPVYIGDILQDNAETNVDGTYVTYRVQGRSLGALSMFLRLQRDGMVA